MQKNLRLIARPIVARHECTHVRHCKENAPIYMYDVAPETPMMSSVIADCPDLAPPQYFGQVYAYAVLYKSFPPEAPELCDIAHIQAYTSTNTHTHAGG